MNLISGRLPRALMRVAANGSPPIRAQDDPHTLLAQMKAGIDDFKARHESRYNDIEAAINELSVANAASRLNGGGGSLRAEDPEYTAAFSAYMRSGGREEDIRTAHASGHRHAVLASMSSGSNPDGGYLAPTEWDRQVSQALVITSPMRRLATVKRTGVGAYSTLWKTSGPGSGWVGETASRPATSTPQFAPITFGHGEIYANAGVTQRILDDADFNLANFFAEEVDTEFGRQEGIAFLSGDGVNKPFGLLLYATGAAHEGVHPGGAISSTVSGAASQVTPDGLINLVYDLGAAYRTGAAWLMNSKTAGTIAKLKDGQGNYLWRETLIVGQPATLLGYPVAIDDNMPDVAAGNTPVVFGDFKRGYVINDRIPGLRILRDPYTNKPYVMFYCTKRVGGGVTDPKAVRLLKIAAS